ncbi:MAG: sensor histidine kinase N-terminal domain-containing protein, partial [Pseudomonadota bacterium]|nr:sensor histidine kinase N-terminal domain-containing protein [Pseudomonadota bacterium]
MKNSIRLNLLKWLIAPLLIINLIGAGLTYWLAWAPAQLAFDQSLADAGWALIPRLRDVGGTVLIDLPKQAEQVLRLDHFDAIFFVVRTREGRVVAGDSDFPRLLPPERNNDPLAYGGTMRGEPVRIISLTTRIGSVPVAIGVGETLRKRTRISSRIFIAMLVLESLLTAISIMIIWRGVTRGLFPLKKMQSDLESRGPDELAAVPHSDSPDELVPVVVAINTLLRKVQAGASAQQAFLANVAHQLRTPLAGLQMQIEWLQQRYGAEHDTGHSVRLMRASTERMIRQTNQLLALARAEPSRVEKARREPVQLDALVAESVQYFVELADKKQIDLGFELQPLRVLGDRFLLRDLIDNLIDNAVRYTPPGGTVTVRTSARDGRAVFAVEDNGPG